MFRISYSLNTDNFFQKMTDLESPKKNNDCYFYYYSTCSKGDSCNFRHEPSALGCETVCSFWKEGKCLNVHCNFRHMELRKNRKAIPCYWETKPGGCLKPHCPFMHQNAASPDAQAGKPDSGLAEDRSQGGAYKNVPTVDSLVVNFEEESDNEYGTATSPPKLSVKNRISDEKTSEEIQLEKIQAASAAYYAYPNHGDVIGLQEHNDDLRQRILEKLRSKRKQHPAKIHAAYKRPKLAGNDVENIKIKTLDEIRQQRSLKKEKMSDVEGPTYKRKHSPIRIAEDKGKPAVEDKLGTEETEVTSTSKDETTEDVNPVVKLKVRRLNIQKLKSLAEDCVSSNEIKGLKDEEKRKSDCPETLEEQKIKLDSARLSLDESDLLDDVEDGFNVTLKAEDDLLNEIDDLLND
ncbi:zinc finger CCCH domain-containing protein 11A-like isoform X2 [Cylas formicarius]|uniref:zinc finger CCCH domain-containing protein 11A-like isoform X2 n=1 Tax=Cylas formicarius TaxID=197179 RepID=UPI0029586582|nr:zinc finger CCCH domain-containing protein 11A-like isoform X2 [Cylas formicarius]